MSDSRNFIEALEQENLAGLRAVPKSDLHNHGCFGTRRKKIEEWAKCKIPAPAGKFKTLDEMSAYTYESFIPHVLSQKGVEFMLESAIQDAVYDGVKLLEMSIDARVIAMSFPGTNGQGMISYLHKLQADYSEDIDFRPELGLSRDHAFQELEPLVKLCIDSGAFFSIDLYGNEDAQEPETYTSLYAKAKLAEMKLKAHVGEFGSAESIRHTVETLDLDEVQHGIRAVESPEIMKWLSDNSIRLNVCPTSNVELSRVPSMREHPIRVLYDNGVPVTINTDDLVVFDQSVSEEYLNLFKARVFTANELDLIRQSSLEPV
jgi:adenosine deaminase